MSEERTQYTVHPDIAIRLEIREKYIRQLERTNDGLTMVMGRHRETMREQAERIAELEATVLRQMETIARLEADNRRLRHLDAMPVDALRRIIYDVDVTQTEEWTAISEWLDSRDGAA